MKTTAFCFAAACLLSTSANAVLVSAMSGQVVNDTDLNVTWLANANLAATNTFGVSGIQADGSMGWATAQNWIRAMNSANYLGYNDWRLPTSDNCVGSSNCTGSEMGHLFYIELGQTAAHSISISNNPNKALFTNLQSYVYWSGTTYWSNYEWGFDTRYGTQDYYSSGFNVFALAVRTGQVAAVPVPAAAWLLGSGLLGLIGFARKRITI